jgi:hypothetical protein
MTGGTPERWSGDFTVSEKTPQPIQGGDGLGWVGLRARNA